jgi:hypothetical protein
MESVEIINENISDEEIVKILETDSWLCIFMSKDGTDLETALDLAKRVKELARKTRNTPAKQVVFAKYGEMSRYNIAYARATFPVNGALFYRVDDFQEAYLKFKSEIDEVRKIEVPKLPR